MWYKAGRHAIKIYKPNDVFYSWITINYFHHMKFKWSTVAKLCYTFFNHRGWKPGQVTPHSRTTQSPRRQREPPRPQNASGLILFVASCAVWGYEMETSALQPFTYMRGTRQCSPKWEISVSLTTLQGQRLHKASDWAHTGLNYGIFTSSSAHRLPPPQQWPGGQVWARCPEAPSDGGENSMF